MILRSATEDVPAMAKGAPKPVTTFRSQRDSLPASRTFNWEYELMKAQYLQKKYLVRGLKGMLERGPSA